MPAKILKIAGPLAVVLYAGATPAAAQSETEKFFAGKSINFIVGSRAGGGYATYATALAHHLGKHLPGKPNVVARNMDGAGSLIAANFLFNKAPKDGSTFGALFMGAIMEPLIGNAEKAKFDPRQFQFVGSANREVSICIAWHTAPVKSFAELFDKELVIGTSGVTSSIRQYPTVLHNVLGAKFKMITGYPGSKDAALAMERGETQGMCGLQWSSFITSYKDWLDQKKVRLLVQLSSPSGHPVLNKMGVPKIWEFVKNDGDRKVLQTIFSQLQFGRPYVLPPGVPQDRVEAFRKAFDATMKDEEFLAEAAKLRLGIDPASGGEVQKLVAEIYDTPKAAVERAKKALQ